MTHTHTSLTGPAAIEQTAPEEPPMLALPAELQKTIVEYVSIGDLVSRSAFEACTASSAAERLVRSLILDRGLASMEPERIS